MSQLPALRNDTVIARLERAYAALAEADIPTAKAIADAAAAAEIYAGRRKLGEQVEQQAHAIKIEALRKLGELLNDAPKNAGSRGQLDGRDSSGGTQMEPPETHLITLKELGIDKKTSSMAQKLAALPAKDFEAVRDGHEAIGKAIASVKGKKNGLPKPKIAIADAAKLQAQVEALTARCEQQQDALDALADTDKTLEAFKNNEQVNEMQILRLELKSCKRRRDELMAENASLKKHVAYLQKKLDQK